MTDDLIPRRLLAARERRRHVTRFGHDFDAVVAIVCTDRGQHGERSIEAMKREGRQWFTVSDELATTARQAHEAALAERTDRGDPNTHGKWVQRDGETRSRHIGGVRQTRHGVEVRCPTCHQRRQYPGVSFYRGLDALAERGETTLDASRT